MFGEVSIEEEGKIRELLERHGYSGTVQIAHAITQDEYVVLLESVARDRLPPGGLDDELGERVGKQVTVKFAEH